MYVILYLVPDQPPQNVSATSTATTITVCFDFPEESTQNGQITSFKFTLVGTPFDTESQTVRIPVTSTENPLTGSLCGDFNDLEEYNDYNITSVVLINGAGTGTSSPSVQVQTLQAG